MPASLLNLSFKHRCYTSKKKPHVACYVKTPLAARCAGKAMSPEPAMGAYLAGADAISAINTVKSVTLGDESDVNGRQKDNEKAISFTGTGQLAEKNAGFAEYLLSRPFQGGIFGIFGCKCI